MSLPGLLNPDPAPPTPGGPNAASGELLASALVGAPLEELERLAGGLHAVDPAAIEGNDRRIAFWLNAYNALLRHAVAVRPMRGSVLRHLRLFGHARYRVGSEDYSLNVIEHGLLRANARPPVGMRRALRSGDPRLAAAPARRDPRVHFALNCGARSCPSPRIHTPAGLDAELRDSTETYLAGEVHVDRDAVLVTLPGLCKLYRADFGSEPALVRWVAGHLRSDDAAWLAEHADDVSVRYGHFDWSAAAD